MAAMVEVATEVAVTEMVMETEEEMVAEMMETEAAQLVMEMRVVIEVVNRAERRVMREAQVELWAPSARALRAGFTSETLRGAEHAA